MSTRLFIYGTLKRGGRLHRYMRDQKFLGEVKTTPQYRLFNVSWFPGLREQADEDEGEGKEIEGELYEVDDRCLAILDQVEGVPSLLDERRAVTVQNPPISDDGEKLVQSYFYKGDVSKLAEAGTCWPVGGE